MIQKRCLTFFISNALWSRFCILFFIISNLSRDPKYYLYKDQRNLQRSTKIFLSWRVKRNSHLISRSKQNSEAIFGKNYRLMCTEVRVKNFDILLEELSIPALSLIKTSRLDLVLWRLLIILDIFFETCLTDIIHTTNVYCTRCLAVAAKWKRSES